MKKVLFLLIAIIFAIQGWTQTLNESFEGDSFPPDDWTIATTLGSGNWQSSTTIAHTGTKSAKSGYASSGCTRWLITPKLSVTSDATNFAFWIATDFWYSDSDNIDILVSTTDNQPSSFSTTSLLSLNADSITTAWMQHSIDLSAYIGQNIYVAIRVVDNDGFDSFIDDVTGPNLFVPTCPKPTALNTSNITTTNAQIGWTDATGTLWNIQYMLASETDWTNSTSITGITSNPYTITGLNPATQYKARLQRDCGTEQSEWSTITTFSTACEAISAFPWEEGFETTPWAAAVAPGNALAPNCWLNINGGYASTSYIWRRTANPSYIHSGTGAAQMYTSASQVTNDWLITPPITLNGNERLRFWAKGYSTYADQIGVRIYNITTHAADLALVTDTTLFTEIMPNTLVSATEWTEYEINLSQYSGDYRIAFVRNTIGGYFLNLDDVSISTIPNCIRPTSVILDTVTTIDAQFSWIPGNQSDGSWYIYYKTAAATDYDSVLVTSSPYILQNLTSNTPYNVYLKTDCGSDLSEATNILSFRTACDVISTLPYTENFDAYQSGTFPYCWARPVIYNSYGNNYPSSSSTNHSAPNSIIFQSSTFIPTYAVTPAFSADINTLMVSMWLKATNLTYSGTITVGVMDSPTDTSTFEEVQTIIPTTTDWTQYIIMLNDVQLQGGNKYIAFKHNSNSSSYTLFLDDIVVNVIPDCPDVYGIIAEAASATSVSVNWTDEGDNGEGYNIAYSTNLTGTFDPTTATIIPVTTGTTLPYIISGFNPSDSVWVAIQRGCLGAWTNAVKVNLPAFVNGLPLIANFEDSTLDTVWTILNGTQTNKWYIGAPGANDSNSTDANAERGLYISNDLGVTASYSNTATSVVLASTLVAFDNSPSFQLSFDWSNVGESGYDGINIYLLPIEETLTPGTLPSDQYKLNPSYLCGQTTFHTYNQIFNATYANTVRRLVFAWENDYMYGNNPPARIDNISLVAISCGMPYGLAIDSASYTGTGAYLRWTEPQAVNSWIVEYKQTETNVWTQVAVTTNPFNLTGLIPGTSYEARVRSICNSQDTSAISNVICFQTACIALSAPTAVEEFNVVLPNCWQKATGILPTSGTSTLSSTTFGWSSSSSPMQSGWGSHAYLYLSSSTNYWLITPSINVGDGTSPMQIEFDLSYSNSNALSPVNSGDTDNTFAVVISTDNGLTWNSSNIIRKYDNSTTSSITLDSIGVTPDHIVIPLFDSLSQPYIGDIKIGLFGSSLTNSVNAYLHIDNFDVLPFATCQRPTSLQASEITSATTNISFQENGTATTWQYVLSNGTITDPNNGTPVTTTTNPIQLTGLTPQTQYTIWVRSDCSAETSFWSTPLTFLTEALPAQVPYTFDFENQTESLAWRNLSGSVNNWAIGQAAGNGTSTTNSADSTAAYISNNNGESYAMTSGSIYAYGYRDIDFGSTPASYSLTFDWKCQGYVYGNSIYAGLKVFLCDVTESLSPTGFQNVNDNLGLFAGSSTWQNAQIPIDNVSGVKRLIFYYFDGYYNYDPPAAIDNISIIELTCPRPFNVTSSNSTTTSSEISWSHPGADSYIVSYRTAYGTTLTDEAAITSPYTIQGLTLGTQYIVTVRAICGQDTTMYSESTLFSTPCADGAISTFPWTEGFENGLNCWQQEFVVGTTNWTNTSYYNSSNTGTGFANFFNISGNKTKLISPILDISALSQPYVSFYHMQEVWGGDQDQLKVFYRTSSADAWVELVNYTSNIANYTFDSFLLPNPSSTYQMAFEGIGNSGYGVALDDITVYDANQITCIPPTNIIVNPYDTYASVIWTAGNQETAWQVRLGVNGTPIDVTTTSYQLTNLVAGSNDTVYVRANCGTNYSTWVSLAFTTNYGYQLPTVTTAQQTGTNQTSTTLNGSYIQGTNSILVKGFQWKQSSASAWTTVPVSAGTTPFSYALNGLTANTQYEFRAYVETSLDTTYGAIIQFTTLANVLPTVTTTQVTNINQTTATFNGTTSQGTEPIQARGFEYKETSTSTWTGAIDVTAYGTTTITANVNGLNANTQYDVRAYAQTLSDGRTYGNIETFTTLGNTIVLGEVTTQIVSSLLDHSATLNGTLVSTGNAVEDIELGFVYSTTANPIIGGNDVIIDTVTYSEGMTTFSKSISGLLFGTNYYCKAYITNSAGTAYGEEKPFLTAGLNDVNSNKFSVSMSPNPATNSTLLVVNGVDGETDIIINDVQGKLIYKTSSKAVNGKVEQTIDVNNFAKGVYYVRIQNQTTSRTQKLIVID